MLFKSVASFGRSAAAVKTLWVPVSSNQQVPSFFVSTPQFKRHQHQVAVYTGDTRGAHNSTHRGLSAAPGSAGATTASLDDEQRRDEAPSRISRLVRIVPRTVPDNVSSDSTTADVVLESASHDMEKEGSFDGDLIENRDWVGAMREAQAAGKHLQVLEAFSALELEQREISLDAYNIALCSLSELALEAGDVAVLLQAYERLLVRGVVPSRDTYAIVIGTLVQMATLLGEKRQLWAPIVGEGLESGDEVLETLAVEDHLRLAQRILAASVSVDSSNYDQKVVDALVDACAKYGVPFDDATLMKLATPSTAHVRLSQSSREAHKFAQKLPNMPQTDVTLLETLGRLGDIKGAAKLYEDRNAPIWLRQSLAEAFSRNGFLATALRWCLKCSSINAGQVLAKAVTSPQDKEEVLGSAYKLFEVATARNQMTLEARSSILQLMSSHLPALLTVIKESKLRDAMWTPTTLVAVVEALIKNHNEPLLAVDLFAWQARKLHAQWKKHDITSFVGQELVQQVVGALQSTDSLDLMAAAVLAPFALASQRSRDAVFELLWTARLAAPGEFRQAVNAEQLVGLLDTHAQWVLGGSFSGITDSQRAQIGDFVPRLAEDVLVSGQPLPQHLVKLVIQCLSVLGINDEDALIHLWSKKLSRSTSSNNDSVSSPSVSSFSASIERYAKTPNGLDKALELLERAQLLRQDVSGSALTALVEAFEAAGEPLSKLDGFVKSEVPMYLSALARAAAPDNWSLAFQAYSQLSNPDPDTVAAMLRHVPENDMLQLVHSLKPPLAPAVANAALVRLARAGKTADVTQLQTTMSSSSLLEPDTVAEIIQLACRRRDFAEVEKLLAEFGAQAPVSAYNSVMSMYIANGNQRGALAAFTTMRQRLGAVAPTPHSYRLLMEAYLIPTPEPNLERADHVLALMRSEGAPVTSQCWATLIRARGVLMRDFEGARDFYRGLVKNSRVLPDKRIFRALLESYVATGHRSETKRVLHEMAKYHVPLDNELRTLAL